MSTVSAGQSVQLQIGVFDGLWVNCSGVGFVDFECKSRSTIQLATQYQRIGFYGESICVELRCVSGVIDYSTSPVGFSPLTARQGGDGNDSSPLDIKLAVNSLALYPAKQSQSVVLLGDSYAETQNFPPIGNTSSFSLYRFILGRLGNAVNVVKNAGVSGNTASQMLARIDSDVLSCSSDWVFFNCGINDFYGSGLTADAVKPDVISILSKLNTAGRKVLMFNCPPQVTTRSGFSAAKSTECAKYNNWLSNYVNTINGVLLVDLYSAFLNWSDTTNAGAIAAFFASDGIHLSTLGEITAADVAMPVIGDNIKPDLSLLNSPLDLGIAGTEGLFIGTSGSNGGGSSGSVATGFTSSRVSGTNGTIVCSKLPLRGQRQTVTLTAANGEVKTRLLNGLLAELTPYIGKVVTTRILFRLRTTSGGVSLKDVLAKLYTADGSGLNQAINGGPQGGYAPITDTQFDTGLSLITLRNLTVGAGLSDAGLYFELLLDSVAGGVVEFDIYGVDIREVIA